MDSPYKDWFCINFDGNTGYNDGFYYEGWEGHYELVKLNLRNPAVVDYLLECVKFWIDEFDIDGLRLDVAYSLDHDFMRRLRSFCQSMKPDFALIGEVLFGDYNTCFDTPLPNDLTEYIKKLISIRQNSDALCHGSYFNLVMQNHYLVFERRTDNERVIVAINASGDTQTAYHHSFNGDYIELITDETSVLNGSLELPPYSVQYLKMYP